MTTVFADLDNSGFPFSNGLAVNNHASSSSLYDDQRTLQLAVELSKLGLQQQQTNNNNNNNNCGDSHSSSCSDPGGYCDTDLFNLSQRKSQNTTECVPVPSSEHVAEIVGRQGCKIKALRAKTNTYIKTPVRGEEPVFVVTGRKEDVEAAKQEILSAADHFTQIRASRRHSQGGIPAPGHITAYVRVPYKLVGLVVGPKGATIKRIQQQTHTYIITPSRDKEPIFEVTGLPDNVETARNEIELHIASRTGSFSPSFDCSPKDSMMMAMDEFGTSNGPMNDPNGMAYGGNTESAYGSGADVSALKNLPQTRSLNYLANNSAAAGVQQSYGGSAASVAALNSRNGCGAWMSYAQTHGDQDEGVWSMSGDSPTSLSIEPLLPPCLSSIWSDLEDPKDMFPRRSASISVPGVENTGSAMFSNVASQLSSWSTNGGTNEQRGVGSLVNGYSNNNLTSASGGGGVSQRRFSSAPTTSGLYRQVVANMLALNSSCHVCRVKPVEAALGPCGHRCFCFVCATRLCQMPKPVCPICQAPIASSVRLVPANQQQQQTS